MNENPKIICIDARYLFPRMDGIGRYLYNLIDEISTLTELRKDIHFLILEIDEFAEKSPLRFLEKRKNLRFVKMSIFPQTIKNNFLQFYLRSYHIDLFHYPQFDFPFFMNLPSVVTIHDLNPQIYKNFFRGLKGILKKYASILMNYVALNKASKVIAISKSTKEELVNFYGLKYAKKIEIVCSGVDQKLCDIQKNDFNKNLLETIKSQYGFEKYFLYVGNDRPHKNIKNLLRSFRKFKLLNDNNIKFILAGNFVFEGNLKLEEELTKLELQEEVIHFVPDEEQLICLYLYAEAFLFLSLSEGFGLPILESMALGTPVITSDRSSMKEIGGEAAYLVDPQDIEAITKAMIQIVKFPSSRERLVALGKDQAQKYTWKHCASETLAIYEKILK